MTISQVESAQARTLKPELGHTQIQGKLAAFKPETYNSIGSMHKYWGKKPYNVISTLIEHYTNEGELVLDPFCGSGVTTTQAFLLNRKAIGIDINPTAVLLSQESIAPLDLKAFDKAVLELSSLLEPLLERLYTYPCSCKENALMIAAVRTRSEELCRLKLKCRLCGTIERTADSNDKSLTLISDAQEIDFWYPKDLLIPNGRINVKKGQAIQDLFTKRNLHLCAALWSYISKIEDSRIRSALQVAFTANLSNASKLTPIIKQRGAMNAGAWMTGFYVASEFLEQNVLHYFLNRVEKVRKAKVELSKNLPDEIIHEAKFYQADCGNLNFMKKDSVDFVIADPPYGDTIPYLEQSILWNSWFGFDKALLEQEIVISDAPGRNKKLAGYIEGISRAFKEINRVMKPGATMCVTFHNMRGEIWSAFVKAILTSGFQLIDVLTIYQKTSTPRQLNRLDSIKCDFLLIFENIRNYGEPALLELKQCERMLFESIERLILREGPASTDMLFSEGLTSILRKGVPPADFDIIESVSRAFTYKDGFWLMSSLQ